MGVSMVTHVFFGYVCSDKLSLWIRDNFVDEDGQFYVDNKNFYRGAKIGNLDVVVGESVTLIGKKLSSSPDGRYECMTMDEEWKIEEFYEHAFQCGCAINEFYADFSPPSVCRFTRTGSLIIKTLYS